MLGSLYTWQGFNDFQEFWRVERFHDLFWKGFFIGNDMIFIVWLQIEFDNILSEFLLLFEPSRW